MRMGLRCRKCGHAFSVPMYRCGDGVWRYDSAHFECCGCPECGKKEDRERVFRRSVLEETGAFEEDPA